MAESVMGTTGTDRYAIVTGANKGIGLEICKKLASNGVKVVLTSRDEKKGAEAIEKLRSLGLDENVVFHKVDVVDDSSIASLADFVQTQFGRLDILVNNAGISGTSVNYDATQAGGDHQINWNEITTETYEQAIDCLKTNYHGPKKIIETFIPLLRLSKSPRIVNVSSAMGKLKRIKNEWAKKVLSDDAITDERVNEVLEEFLRDFKQGSLQAKGWPNLWSAYAVSKAALNAYTRILAKQHPGFCINCVCPGNVKTDINFNSGMLSPGEGAEGPVRLALLPDGGPSGLFFVHTEESSF